jgi:hypothetical protein
VPSFSGFIALSIIGSNDLLDSHLGLQFHNWAPLTYWVPLASSTNRYPPLPCLNGAHPTLAAR